MGIKYVPDKQGTQELVTSAPVGKACLKAAQIVKTAAAQTPITNPEATEKDIVDYRQSFATTTATVATKKGPRPGAIVTNDYVRERVLGARHRVLYHALEAIDGEVV